MLPPRLARSVVLLATMLLAGPGEATAPRAADAAPRAKAPPGCAGTISGSVKGEFECEATLTAGDEGRVYLVITPRKPVDGIASLVPGAFDVTGVLRPGTYHLQDLGMGKASVAVEGGALYTATKTSSQRGEVTLVLTSVREVGAGGSYEVRGTYRARLLPAGAGKQGEVVVAVEFQAGRP